MPDPCENSKRVITNSEFEEDPGVNDSLDIYKQRGLPRARVTVHGANSDNCDEGQDYHKVVHHEAHQDAQRELGGETLDPKPHDYDDANGRWVLEYFPQG